MDKQITIKKIVYPGKSLGHLGEKTVFTNEGIPEEIVEVEPLQEKKKITMARTTAVIKPSAHRVKARCGHYQSCSSYQYIDYETQLKIKEDQVKEIFLHTFGEIPEKISMTASPEIWGYRNKIRLNVIREKGQVYLAYNEPESHDRFARVDHCWLVSERINSLLDAFLETLKNAKDKLGSISEIEVKESQHKKDLLLVAYSASDKELEDISSALKPLAQDFPMAGIVCVIAGNRTQEEYIIHGKNLIEEDVESKKFFIGPRSFFQINIPILKPVLSDMNEFIKPKPDNTIVDAYCGAGLFGVYFSGSVKETIGIEPSGDNIPLLKKNINANGIKNFQFLCGPCERHLSRVLRHNADILILDPPRKGISQLVGKKILSNPSRKILYLSCNPSTLVRDLKNLAGTYYIKQIKIYDFFPHTPHIEVLAMLSRR